MFTNITRKLIASIKHFIFITPEKPYNPYDESLDRFAYISTIICIAAVAVYLSIDGFLGINLTDYMPPCTLYSHTGYYCPGCGGTRSILLFLKGDLAGSLLYHPIIVYTAVPGIWFFISHSIFHLQNHMASKTTDVYSGKNASKNRTTINPAVRPLSIHLAYIYVGTAILLLQCLTKNLLKLLAGYSLI